MTGQRSSNDNDRYVQPNKERGGWDVVKELHKQASAHTETRQEAITRARQIIRNQGGGELRIKNERGQLIESDTIKPGRESPARDRREATMQLDKQEVVDLLRKEGKDEHVQIALRELPDKIDHEQHAQMLE